MKLRRLELRAFGPFTDVTLDLTGPEGRLHLIHGRNEAGKSTTLRALRGVLFGIPHVTPDAHAHAMRDLRIGAVLQDGARGTVEVLRRKARKNALLDLANETPVDPAVLEDLLGGMDEALFDAMYGLDHESLRRGGEALLRGEGELGATLLDAGLGGTGIHQVLAALDAEAERIFLPHGKNPALNQALRALSERKKSVRQGEVSADGWHAQKAALEALEAELHGLDEQVRERAREKYHLERIRDVLGPLQQLRVARAQREALGEVPPLSDEAMEERVDAERARDAALADMDALAADARKLDERLRHLQVPDGLVDVPGEVLKDLSDRLGSHRRARADEPQLRARLRHLEEDARALLERVRPGTDLDQAANLRLRSGLAERVRELAHEHSGLAASRDRARRTLCSLEDRLAVAEGRVRREVGLDAAVDLETLAVPSEGEIAEFATGFAEVAEAHRSLRDAREALASDVAETERRLDAERRQGEVPTEDQLSEARAEREALWERVRRLGVEAGPAGAFESAVARADDLADRLRREASRVATHAQLMAGRDALVHRREALDARERELAEREGDLRGRWSDAWAASGIGPREPEAMQAWRRTLEEVRRQSAEVRDAAAEARRWDEALDAWQAQWAGCMGEVGVGSDATAAEAAAVVDDLKALLAKVEAATEQRRRLDALERDARDFATRVDELVQAHAADLGERPLEERAEALVERWHRVQSERDERRSREEDLRVKQEQLEEARRRRGDAEGGLDRLMERAGVGDLESLRHAEARARQARDLEAQISRLEAHILERGQGATVVELSEQARGLEVAEVRTRIDELGRELRALDQKRTQTAQQLGSTEAGLRVLEERSAAQAAEDVAEALARVKAHAHRYVRVRMASAVLRRELERYRDKYQGPVLARAQSLFPRLTRSAYQGLKVGYGADDEPVLVCVRFDGKEVGPGDLSDGTRDQLYLALRVATIAHNASSGSPLPFVLDDVFVHFDDERARAGLEVLGELAETTQVLLFTHHARLVELARDAIPAERLCIHDLDALRGRAPSLAGLEATPGRDSR